MNRRAGPSDPRDLLGRRNGPGTLKLRVLVVTPVGSITQRITSDEVIAHCFVEHPRQLGYRALERGARVRRLPVIDGSVDETRRDLAHAHMAQAGKDPEPQSGSVSACSRRRINAAKVPVADRTRVVVQSDERIDNAGRTRAHEFEEILGGGCRCPPSQSGFCAHVKADQSSGCARECGIRGSVYRRVGGFRTEGPRNRR